MLTEEDINRGLDLFEEHLINYDKFFRQRNKSPKNFDWRPYRWCSRDIVFSLVVVKHNRQGNYLEVDVCLITNPPQYVENSGAKVALGFLLSEAFKCGGSMEIVFTKNVEGGRVPAYICDLAIGYGVKLKHVFEGHITPLEARQLYLELAGFSDMAKNRIKELAIKGEISPERACFVVMGGLWSLQEIEGIILSSRHPERILSSVSLPSDRHLYLTDLSISRNVILGGTLDRKLLRAEIVENDLVVESEDIESPLNIGFDPVHFAKIYTSDVDMVIPWLRETEKTLKAGQQMVVLIRARSDIEIKRYFLRDLESLTGLVTNFKNEDIETLIFYLTTRDFNDLPEDEQLRIIETLGEHGFFLMISPDNIASLNKEAIRRLETGRITRQ